MNKITLVKNSEREKGGSVDPMAAIPGRFYTKSFDFRDLESSRHSIYFATDTVGKDGRLFVCYPIGDTVKTGCYLRWSKNYSMYEVEVEEIDVNIKVSRIYR
jgi:hypothetical protein